MGANAGAKSTGLVELVAALKGPAFRDVNQALRPMARGIADEMRPQVELLVRMSRAPQAAAMARTVRTKNDRVPVVIVGHTNPKFAHSKFARRGSDTKARRGSLAHGVIYGPKGGKRSTSAHEDYYHIPRDDDGGAFGRSMKTGSFAVKANELYMEAFFAILTHYGFIKQGSNVTWGG